MLKRIVFVALLVFMLGGTMLQVSAQEDSALCGMGTGETATGEPINVGAVVGATGPEDFSSSAKAAQAYFNCVNENGGINGRPINYIVEDDQWNPEVAAQVASKLVNDDNVVALIASSSFVEGPVNAQLYADSNVLSIPGVCVPRECFEASNIAVTNQGIRLSTLGVAQYAHEEWGANKFSCIALIIPNVGEWACRAVEEWGADQGVTSEFIPFDPASADPTSLVLQAAASNPDVILVTLPAGAGLAILQAAEEQDLRDQFKFISSTPLYDEDIPAALGDYWDGALTIEIELTPLDTEGGDMARWRQVMDEYGNDDDPRDTFSQAGFIAANVFVDTLMELDPGSITRDTVTEALRNVKNYSSDMLCSPWYFGPGDLHAPNHAGLIVEYADGSFQTIKQCFEIVDPDLAPILELEQSEGLAG